jgi:hypothetical protein
VTYTASVTRRLRRRTVRSPRTSATRRAVPSPRRSRSVVVWSPRSWIPHRQRLTGGYADAPAKPTDPDDDFSDLHRWFNLEMFLLGIVAALYAVGFVIFVVWRQSQLNSDTRQPSADARTEAQVRDARNLYVVGVLAGVFLFASSMLLLVTAFSPTISHATWINWLVRCSPCSLVLPSARTARSTCRLHLDRRRR